ELRQPCHPVVRGEVVHQEAVVLGHGLRVVASGPPEVERVVRRATDPAVPVGEGQLDGAMGRTCGVQVPYFRKSGTSRSSSSNSSCGRCGGGTPAPTGPRRASWSAVPPAFLAASASAAARVCSCVCCTTGGA